MDQSNAPSTKGKGLGLAAMIIGIVALLFSIIPFFGIAAIYLGVPGLILGVIAFFMAKSGNNPKKGIIIAGIILNFLATAWAGYQAYSFAKAAANIGDDLQHMIDTMKIDTTSMH